MFVKEFTSTGSVRIGSYNVAPETRRSVNGVTTSTSASQTPFANDDALPVAPVNTGLLGSTRVNTRNGPVAIETLNAGQPILTSSGKQARVLFVLPAEKPTSALRIRAPYFGANQDFVIGNDHHIEVKSDLAEYMFGVSHVLAPAWVFKDNSKVLFHELTKSDMMYQIQIEGADGFGIGGCFVAPLLSGSKVDTKRILNDAEARAFATERKIGQYN